MQDKLIEVETAKLAKQKGFQKFNLTSEIEGEFHFYDNDGKIQSGYYKNGSGSKSGAMTNDKKIGAIYSNSCEAPTQTLLQTWLRNIHKIFVLVFYDGKSFYYQIQRPEWDNCITHFELNKVFTYEQALELGLLEGLKMIP